MATYTHTAVSQRVLPQHAFVSGPLAKGRTGSATSITPRALPSIRDVVQLWDGPQCVAALVVSAADSTKLNVAQSVGKGYSDPRGLILKVVSDGGVTGTYDVSYA